MRDLKEAIKPQFQAKLVGLDISDDLNMHTDRSGRKGQVEVFLPKKFDIVGAWEDDTTKEIKRDLAGEGSASGRRKKVKKTRGGESEDGDNIEERVSKAQGEREDQEKIKSLKDERDIMVLEKPPSRAERRRKIKEDLVTSGEGETFTGYRRRVPAA